MSAGNGRRVAVDIGLLPNRATAAETAALAELAEARGLNGAWAADSPSVFRDAFVTLAACAQRTSVLVLGTAVTNPVTHDPTVLAGMCATLDELSGGRFVLGIGAGESAVRNAGLRPATLAQLEESVAAVRSLLAAGSAVYEGRELSFAYGSGPARIYLGASGPRMLELAGRIADGVIFQVGSAPSAVEYALERIAAGAASAGRELGDIELCARLAVSIAADGSRARDEMRAYAGIAANTIARTVPRSALPDEVHADLDALRSAYEYGLHGAAAAAHSALVTDRVLGVVAAAGTADEVAVRLGAIAAVGVDRIIVPLNVSANRELLEALARDVVPALG